MARNVQFIPVSLTKDSIPQNKCVQSTYCGSGLGTTGGMGPRPTQGNEEHKRRGGKGEQEGFPQEGTSGLGLQDG